MGLMAKLGLSRKGSPVLIDFGEVAAVVPRADGGGCAVYLKGGAVVMVDESSAEVQKLASLFLTMVNQAPGTKRGPGQ